MTTQPKKWKMAILTWIAIYPTITILLLIADPLLDKLGSIPSRTLLLSLVMVPFMVFLLMPILLKLCRHWLQR
jgi:antibiotic biosynthesis monooxygenase (ABM) superfamily enzyme